MHSNVKTRLSWRLVKEANGGLTPKQAAFAREYVANGGNGTAAATKVCRVRSREAASSGATEFLRIPAVRKEIQRLLAPLDVTKTSVLARLIHLSKEAESSTVRLRATESLAKILGLL